MGQSSRFGILFVGSVIFGLGLFLWLVQKMPPNPKPPPPVTLSPSSFQAMADKNAALADGKAKYWVQHGVVEIYIHNITRPAYKPLESLAVGLDRYPEATRFCVTWECFWGRHGSTTTAFYDRRTHRLIYRCVGNSVPWGGFSEYKVFTMVTDQSLRQDARNHKLSTLGLPCDGDDLDIVFNDLPQYGCSQKFAAKRFQPA